MRGLMDASNRARLKAAERLNTERDERHADNALLY